MSKMIQLRHVPDAVHRKLKSRAARKGMSLSDYLVREVSRLAELPSMEEWLEQVHTRTPIELAEPSAVTIRRLRDSR
jgi:plasmid stability protein